MTSPVYRAPGLRWPVPNVLACCAIVGLILSGWFFFETWTSEEAYDRLFQENADAIERVQAAEMWARRGEDAVPKLREALHSSNPRVREHALLALAYMPVQLARPALPDVLELCEDANLNIQSNALVLASTLTDDLATLATMGVTRLQSTEEETISGALETLGNVGAHAVPALAAAFQNLPPRNQFRSLRLLAQQALDPEQGALALQTMQTSLQAADPAVRQAAFELLVLIRPFTSEQLSHGLRESNATILRIVLKDWNSTSEHSLQDLPRLQELLTLEPRLLPETLSAIAGYGVAAAELLPALMPLAIHPDSKIRRAAAKTIAAVGKNSQESQDVLQGLLLDRDPEVARTAGQLLADLAPESLSQIANEVLLPCLGQAEESVQLSAAAALSAMPQVIVSERLRLIRWISNPSAEQELPSGVQFELVRSLGNMGPSAKDAVPALLGLLQRTPPEDSRLASVVLALGNIESADGQVLDTIQRLYHASQHGDRTEARPFGFYRPSGLYTVHLATIKALGQLGRGHDTVVDLLVNAATTSSSEELRLAAFQALAQLGLDQETAEFLFSIGLKDESAAVQVASCQHLAQLGNPAHAALAIAPMLYHSQAVVRITAAKCLESLGPEAQEAIPDLCQCAADPLNAQPYLLAEDEETSRHDLNLLKLPIYRGSVQHAARSALAAIQPHSVSLTSEDLGRQLVRVR